MVNKLTRNESLIEIASQAGVERPINSGSQITALNFETLPFIENKQYDFNRIEQLMSLSMKENHHANGGPVSRLLEAMVAHTIGLPDSRRVIATSSGTASLHLACGYISLKTTKQSFRWVTSAFNFFSAKVGPLSDSIVIDCTENGGFDLKRLRSLSLDSFDGVVYTNIFAEHSDWFDIANFCKNHGKAFVVDNATGLLDRPSFTGANESIMEVISAHHTKPWGVGEGGFLICDETDEAELRRIAKFGAGLSEDFKTVSNNYKISDYACAAIIDRLERMPSWSPCYYEQEKRLSELLTNSCHELLKFSGSTLPFSPRAHTPFLAPVPVDVSLSTGDVTLRKYYSPLNSTLEIINASSIYDRIFSVSNAPEMCRISDDKIVDQIQRLLIS